MISRSRSLLILRQIGQVFEELETDEENDHHDVIMMIIVAVALKSELCASTIPAFGRHTEGVFFFQNDKKHILSQQFDVQKKR